MGTPTSGKNRRMPQPNEGLGAPAYGTQGYGVGKSRRADGPSQFQPRSNMPSGAIGADTQGLPEIQDTGYMPPASGRYDEGNDVARVGAPPQQRALANAVANPPARTYDPASAAANNPALRPAAPPAAPGLITQRLLANQANPNAPTLAQTVNTAPPPPATTTPPPPARQYAAATSGMQPGAPGAPAAYGIAPVSGTGAYDLAPNGQANWQANWQPASAAAPTVAAPYGTDDYGTPFKSAAQAEDWRRRVAARNAALSDYTFADQAAERGF